MDTGNVRQAALGNTGIQWSFKELCHWRLYLPVTIMKLDIILLLLFVFETGSLYRALVALKLIM